MIRCGTASYLTWNKKYKHNGLVKVVFIDSNECDTVVLVMSEFLKFA